MTLADSLIIMTGLLVIFVCLMLLTRRWWSAEQEIQRRLNIDSPNLPAVPQPNLPTADGRLGLFEGNFHRMRQKAGVDLSVAQWSLILGLSGGVGCLGLFSITNNPLLGIVGLLLGLAVPFVVLSIQARRRRGLIQQQIPDSLFLIARSLRSGAGLERALQVCTENTAQPLRNEFQQSLRQVNLGLSISSALLGMADRLQLEDLDVFVAAVQLNQVAGGSLALMVDRIAKGARERNQFRLQVQSATILPRATAAFIAMVYPVLTLILFRIQPEMMSSLMNSSAGRSVLLLSLVLELTGILWLFAILRTRE